MGKMNTLVVSIIFCLVLGEMVDARSRIGLASSLTLLERDVDESSLSSHEKEGSISDSENSDEEVERRAALYQKEQRVFDLTNSARKVGRYCGSKWHPAVGTLRWNDKLADAARRHSSDMSKKHLLSHIGSDGSSFSTRIKNAGYSYCVAGENIALSSSPDSTVESWLTSSGHCALIMSGNYRDLGVGYASGGSYGNYWTQNFGKAC